MCFVPEMKCVQCAGLAFERMQLTRIYAILLHCQELNDPFKFKL